MLRFIQSLSINLKGRTRVMFDPTRLVLDQSSDMYNETREMYEPTN